MPNDDCYIKIGEELHEGLDAAALLTGVRARQSVEICFAGCPPTDQRLFRSFYEKWRQDTKLLTRFRPVLVLGGVLLFVALAYAAGLVDKVLSVLGLLSSTDSQTEGMDFFADKASLNAFMATIGLILTAGVVFVSRLAAKSALEKAGLRVRDNEISRRLAKDYVLTISEDKLQMTPR